MDRALGGRIAADAHHRGIAQPGGIDCSEHIGLCACDLSEAVAYRELVAVGILHQRAHFYALFGKRNGKLRCVNAVDEDQPRPGLNDRVRLECGTLHCTPPSGDFECTLVQR